jgi:hypothetical protein
MPAPSSIASMSLSNTYHPYYPPHLNVTKEQRALRFGYRYEWCGALAYRTGASVGSVIRGVHAKVGQP